MVERRNNDRSPAMFPLKSSHLYWTNLYTFRLFGRLDESANFAQLRQKHPQLLQEFKGQNSIEIFGSPSVFTKEPQTFRYGWSLNIRQKNMEVCFRCFR